MDKTEIISTGDQTPRNIAKYCENQTTDHEDNNPESCTTNFDSAKEKSLINCSNVLERIKEITDFSAMLTSINQPHLNDTDPKYMPLYLRDVSDMMLQFKSIMDQFDATHADEKVMRDNVINLEKTMQKGKDLIDCEKFTEAIEFYTNALEMCPHNVLLKVNLLHDRAVAYSKMENHQSAIDDCNEALVFCQTNVEILLLRAQCYDFLGELEMSMQDYEVICRKKDEGNESFDDVSKKLEYVQTKLKHKLAEEKNVKGCEHFNKREYGMAVTQFTQAIDLWPDNIVFYYNRSQSLFKLNAFKHTIQDCMQMVSAVARKKIGGCVSTNVLQLRNCEKLALQSYAEKQYLSTILHASRGLDIFPNNANLILLKAECFMHHGDIKEILKLQKQSNLFGADKLYLNSLCHYCRGNLDESLSSLEAALEDDPNHDRSKMLQSKLECLIAKKIDGNNYFIQRRYRKAIDVYTETLEISSSNNMFDFELLYSRATAQSKVGNSHKAIIDCDRALNIRPGHIDVLLLRAKCHKYVGDFRKSLEDFKSALNSDAVRENG
ncbi:dnaJ homolog subfamily C member 7-like isoform X2 [Sitodiplosis mosellana]|uniref:dnaJ homolog subfamily C member 7-like isoform X2 n=1 Tax=Sitodiplosis mosellana TaxID=263140 RepID=UPI0024443F06|nr:dnaJ homolog subfamily C member 7-like isoform X2 [Sitodiplosis mosellana]